MLRQLHVSKWVNDSSGPVGILTTDPGCHRVTNKAFPGSAVSPSIHQRRNRDRQERTHTFCKKSNQFNLTCVWTVIGSVARPCVFIMNHLAYVRTSWNKDRNRFSAVVQAAAFSSRCLIWMWILFCCLDIHCWGSFYFIFIFLAYFEGAYSPNLRPYRSSKMLQINSVRAIVGRFRHFSESFSSFLEQRIYVLNFGWTVGCAAPLKRGLALASLLLLWTVSSKRQKASAPKVSVPSFVVVISHQNLEKSLLLSKCAGWWG